MGNFSRRRPKREKREYYPQAKISMFTVTPSCYQSSLKVCPMQKWKNSKPWFRHLNNNFPKRQLTQYPNYDTIFVIFQERRCHSADQAADFELTPLGQVTPNSINKRQDTPRNHKNDLGPRPSTYGGCDERTRGRARERLAFSTKEESENEKNRRKVSCENKENENFLVPQTPTFRTSRPKMDKTPHQQLSQIPTKPLSPLMAKQLPIVLDDTCKFL